MVAFHDLRAIGLSEDFSVPNGLDHGGFIAFKAALKAKNDELGF